MIVSLNHLNKFFKNANFSAQEVEKALNNIGFEVEEVKPFSDVKGLVFAQVLKVEQNPNSDRLDVVEVKTKLGNFTIQTNNRILKAGDLTICFPIGASKGDMVFNEVTLKGIVSQGMFASWSEIGYDYTLLSEKDQITVFDKDFASLQDDAVEKLGLDDYILDISTTANRNDANSYYTLANELAAYFNVQMVGFNFDNIHPSLQASVVTVQNNPIEDVIFIQAKGQGVTTLQDKMLLAKHGIDAKLPWAVNVTNLLLITMGTPAHVYDLDKLKLGTLSVEKYSGKLNILGNKEIEVNNVTVISNDKQPISIAAVMGLEQYKVTQQSENLLFEIGSFNSSEIRHSAREVKMMSASAAQASRPITKHLVALAAKYLCSNLLQNVAYSNILSQMKLDKIPTINFDQNKLAYYSGVNDIKAFDSAFKALAKLGFELDLTQNLITPPATRYDIELFEDIIEEVLRFYSYDSITEAKHASIPLKTMQFNTVAQNFATQGYSEVRTFTLVSEEKAKFNPFNFVNNQKLQTYVSKEREVIRNSIITSLAQVVEYNQKRKMFDINIFEKGMINNNKMVYGLASTTKSFRQIQSDLINLTGKELKFVPLADNEYIHPNVSAEIIFQDQVVGWIGKLHPRYDATNAFYAEIFTSAFISHDSETKFKEVALDPLKTLDITFELDNNDYLATSLDFIHQIPNADQLKDFKVIDKFQKQNGVNITIRFVGNEEIINLIDAKFNKKGE
ncbi:phenylalanine--tRNA ligase subunit beta [Mycoplasma seminis]|uniref:Phenylalanine--tRNA ligase beta subunit n=1 Tax=Mycoplasma seminis TaxID=512749 RepID=A0ABY9HDZ3_9MOLU|nr:phenylalanine--tRNA ligase subunit beta [Mycoplasma seminis]WLP85893.1 phenylalanine--tRNA ligase subunit beta [Mycoplasma seminis]